MTIWFTSDQHYNHANVIQYSSRPFPDVDTMNEELVQRHNARVQDNDTVLHLGDFSLNEKMVPKFLSRLRGNHTLIPGNHDRCHVRHDGYKAAVARYVSYGFSVWDGAYFEEELVGRLRLHRLTPAHTTPWFDSDMRILMAHIPSTDAEDERYPEYRADPSTYDVLLHGHCHQRWKLRFVGDSIEVNVGVDKWNYAPVNLEEIAAFIREARG